MPIEALPDSAVRALGSGQVLTDPIALIKELVENSLDAHATSISIEVSQNLLDSIQVKDNGHGILTEDRSAVCRRHCTSKIRTYSDITGCRSLGFRGEALASAAEMAKELAFTTKVEGEVVASVCDVGVNGEVKGQRSLGAPVGTTVKITGFFGRLPVRRENALRHTAKYTAKLKKLVATYHLSRRCRISLRILGSPQKTGAKAKNEDVVYASSKTIPEAARKIIGKDPATSCEWFDTSSKPLSDNVEESTEDKIFLQAFLPKPRTDPAMMCKNPQCTQYVFVDSRPVSCSRGTLKELRSMYKSYLRLSFGETAGSLKDPFLYLNIVCPRGSYDPNVEPAKDDVMFSDPNTVLQAVEELFKHVYGELKHRNDGNGRTVEEVTLAHGPELLPGEGGKGNEKGMGSDRDLSHDKEALTGIAAGDAARASEPRSPEWTAVNTRAENEGTTDRTGETRVDREDSSMTRAGRDEGQTQRGQGIPAGSPVTPKRKSSVNWGFNMRSGSIFDSEDDEEPAGPEVLDDEAFENEKVQAWKDITLSNPWTAAKLYAPISRSVPSSPTRTTPTTSPFKRPRPVPSRPLAARPDAGNGSPPSSDGSRTPQRRPPRIPDWGYPSPTRPHRLQESGRTQRRRQQKPPSNAGAMDAFVTHGSRNAGLLQPRQAMRDTEDRIEDSGRDGRADVRAFSSPSRPAPAGTDFMTAARFHREERMQFDDPAEFGDASGFPRPQRTPPAPRPQKRRLQAPPMSDDPDLPIDHDDIDADIDAPPRQRRRTNPHQNRFHVATAALNRHLAAGGAPYLSTPPSPVSDPPETLAKEKTPPPKRTRTRTRTRTLLPLDGIPQPEVQTVKITKPLPLMPIWTLRKLSRRLQGFDPYCAVDVVEPGGEADVDGLGEVERLEETVKAKVKKQKETQRMFSRLRMRVKRGCFDGVEGREDADKENVAAVAAWLRRKDINEAAEELERGWKLEMNEGGGRIVKSTAAYGEGENMDPIADTGLGEKDVGESMLISPEL